MIGGKIGSADDFVYGFGYYTYILADLFI